ncbi:hypothetical protein KR093_002222 [Drosophila rubida]|uniref:NTF2 domain-containing protein n=1 Tax=Drosophila rubida TaxID=30044 RepID=A0AAD4K8C2_9MUSC|nr:hypothetical protein KR093_002222 [Drosophila rubida]
MALNPQYEDIGKGFVQQYYAIFDDPENRASVVNFYSATDSFMTFEGHQIQGAPKILEKVQVSEFNKIRIHTNIWILNELLFQSLSFQKITRVITTVDSQPTFDGGVLINVLGRLQCDDDPPHAFSQVFVLKTNAGTYFVAHDIFRLNIHNSA